MIEGFKKVGMAIIATSLAGALLGVLLGALTDNYLLWIGVMLVVGAGFGLAIGYGFLPES
jgi:drug/metabolite transporter (DMT)-like permease